MSNTTNNNTTSNNTNIQITLVDEKNGRSESIPGLPYYTTTISQLWDWSTALLGITVDTPNKLVFKKDGKTLTGGAINNNTTLHDAGIRNGDLIVVGKQQVKQQASAAASAAASGGISGQLDFSQLLSTTSSSANNAPSSGTSGGLDFSNLLGGGTATAASEATQPPEPVYYPGMNLSEAQAYNRHPQTFCQLLFDKEHLQKELNYYDPVLAQKLLSVGKSNLDLATNIWRQTLVKGGIENAMKASENYKLEHDMKERLTQNPNDKDAIAYYKKKDGQKLIDEQYRHVMQEYPESFGKVLMLYISARINSHKIQAFCDSGAQSTIMSLRLAKICEIDHLIDERLAGVAVGVGTGKILGRIHMVNLQISKYHFPCSVTVMDDPPPGANEIPFLLGLDMMKRHTCCIDLQQMVLKFRLSTEDEFMTTPFLHEYDLNEDQGGTKGFDAEKSNQELLLELRMKESEGEEDSNGSNDGGDKKRKARDHDNDNDDKMDDTK